MLPFAAIGVFWMSLPIPSQPAAGEPNGLFARLGRRARIHHVYFLLAAFDLAAVGTGLYLSHRMQEILAANISSTVEWGALQNTISDVRRAAATANAPGNDIFATHDLVNELGKWDTQFEAFEHKLEDMKHQVQRRIPADRRAEAMKHIEAIDTVFEQLATTSTQVFDRYRRGQYDAAAPAMAVMNRQNAELIGQLDDLSNVLHDILVTRQKSEATAAESMRSMEFMLAGMLVVMVLAVTTFGHWIGKRSQRQYADLDAANQRQQELMRDLGASHASVLDLNAELDALNRNLEERIEARTHELSTANDVITELNVELTNSIVQLRSAQDEIVRRGRMAQLGQLTATVAHEIRNPLGSIRTAAYLVEHRARGHNLGIERQIERINSAIHRCDTIITQLMDFMRSKSMTVETVKLDQWLNACIEAERHQIADCIHIEMDLDAGDEEVEIDAERMHRLVLNLVKNASEAMVGNGEYLKVREGEEPTIWISTAIDGDDAIVSVADNGPGIAADDIGKIVEPLFTTKSFGVGLGLTVVEEILHQHGGRLEIVSEPGDGAMFTARFTRRMPAVAAA